MYSSTSDNTYLYCIASLCVCIFSEYHGIMLVQGCLFAHNTYYLFPVERYHCNPARFPCKNAKEVESSIARMYDTSWTERVGWTMIMNHLPSNSTSNMRPRASFGLGLFFLISSTDLSAESIHNKTFNRLLPRWIMQSIYTSSYTKIQTSKHMNHEIKQ